MVYQLLDLLGIYFGEKTKHKEKYSLDVDHYAEGLQKTEGWCICACSLFHFFMAGTNCILLTHFPRVTALEDLAD